MNKRAPEEKLPRLRFTRDDDTSFPDWEEKRLGDVATFSKGVGVSKSNITTDGKIPCIAYGELFTIYAEIILSISSYTSVKTGILSKKGDILMPASDVTPNGLGKASALMLDDVLIGGDVNILRPQDGVQSIFLSYLINSRQKRFLELVTGTTIRHLYLSDIAKVEVKIPHPKEQAKIAGCLSSLDDLITAQTEKLNVLKNHKKGMLQQLFSQTLRFTRDDGTSFPDWEEKRLGDVADIMGGGTPESGNAEFWGGDINWFTPTEIKTKYLTTSVRKLTQTGLKKSSAKLLPVGTLLLSTRATIGDIGIATAECTTNQGFQSLTVFDGESNEFWYYWISHNKTEFIKRSNGSTFNEIGKASVESIIALKPHPDEQAKIAGCLSSLDDLITAQAEKLNVLEDHKKGMLQQLFPAREANGT